MRFFCGKISQRFFRNQNFSNWTTFSFPWFFPRISPFRFIVREILQDQTFDRRLLLNLILCRRNFCKIVMEWWNWDSSAVRFCRNLFPKSKFFELNHVFLSIFRSFEFIVAEILQNQTFESKHVYYLIRNLLFFVAKIFVTIEILLR